MKQETLEEVAIRLVKKNTLYGSQEATIGSSARSYFETELSCVLMGMNWQKQQGYSEEDMDNYAEYCTTHVLTSKTGHPYLSVKEWFEQFSKLKNG